MDVNAEWPDQDRRDDALDRVHGRIQTMRTPRPVQPRRDKQTPAETRVLVCISHGMTVRMAADSIGVSYNTAHDQLRDARRRMAAKNTAHAVAIACRNGWID